MPRKLAIFVEGQTEQIFVERLLLEIAGRRDIYFERSSPRSRQRGRPVILEEPSGSDRRFYALIHDCGADNRVTSDIRDHHSNLVRAGFSLILGLRDVFPEPNSKLPLLRSGAAKVLPKGAPPVHLVFAIREIEAWFLAEDSHFAEIHPALNPARVLAELPDHLKIDTTTMSVEDDVDHPSETLHAIYQLERLAYRKRGKQVQRTVDVLDFARLYLELPDRVPALRELRDHIDGFLSI